MHVYWITGLPSWLNKHGSTCAATLDAAREVTDQIKRPEQRAEVLVTLREVETDKKAIVRTLNGEGGYRGLALRAWDIGPRGGLREVPTEDAQP